MTISTRIMSDFKNEIERGEKKRARDILCSILTVKMKMTRENTAQELELHIIEPYSYSVPLDAFITDL